MEPRPRLIATGCHLPHEITRCYLPLHTSKHTPPYPQPDRPVLDLPSLEGWKADLTCVVAVTYRDDLPV